MVTYYSAAIIEHARPGYVCVGGGAVQTNPPF